MDSSVKPQPERWPMPDGPSPEQPARLHAFVRGRVQGVYFRDFARRHAQRLRVVGWVRNLPDGNSLEVLAEGPRPALEELLEHLRKGPPGATVMQVDYEWLTARCELTSFQVKW